MTDDKTTGDTDEQSEEVVETAKTKLQSLVEYTGDDYSQYREDYKYYQKRYRYRQPAQIMHRHKYLHRGDQ